MRHRWILLTNSTAWPAIISHIYYSRAKAASQRARFRNQRRERRLFGPLSDQFFSDAFDHDPGELDFVARNLALVLDLKRHVLIVEILDEGNVVSVDRAVLDGPSPRFDLAVPVSLVPSTLNVYV